MSKSGRKHSDDQIKRQSYWRLLKYTAPYKYRLAVGILAGFLSGGSLFGGMLMIPHLMKGVVQEPEPASQVSTQSQVPVPVQAIQPSESPSPPPQRKPDSKLATEIEKYSKKLKDYGPSGSDLQYADGTVILSWRSHSLSLPAEDSKGKMTWQFFSLFVLGFIILWFFKNLGTYINHYYTRWVGTKVIADLRDEAFSRLVSQSLRYYGKMDIGQMISRCTNDTAAIETSVANSIADATRCPIEILACLAAIVLASIQYKNLALPLILFIGLPLCVIPVVIMGRKIRKMYKKSFAQIADVVTRMHEVFTSILIVKAYHAERREISRFNGINSKYFRTVNRALRAQLMMAPLMEVVAVTATLIFLVFSYSREVTLTELAQLLVPCFMAYTPIKNLAKVSTYIQRSMAAADRYFNLIDVDTSIKERENPVEMKDFKSSIQFKDVVFAYESKRILDGVSFSIPKGHVVAVVGETGSGKTTIANLIARFYDADSGSVSIDTIDVRDMKIASLRDMIGIITQDPLLFNASVAENIAYGCPDASREQIAEAAKMASAHQFIVDGRHSEGYDTLVGEKGCKLSGGEKQRVSIARAILKNPPILILDEATSALDTVTERLVQDALNRVMENRTVFAIAHRLSTIKHANRIIVLDKGSIVESGTHDELMSLGGRYKKLHDTQFGIRNDEERRTFKESS